MPHLTLEYTTNLPAEIASRDLLLSLHRALERVGGIRLGNCKSRAVPLASFAVGGGEEEKAAFVHLEVRFLEGRSPETRAAVGEELLRLLREAYGERAPGFQVTVEVGEIQRPAYFKHPPGTLG